MKRFLMVIAVLTYSLSYARSQSTSFFFPDYKLYFRSNNTCNQKAVRSIQSWQYLKIKVYDSCKFVEVSCYRSKDSTLKEKGLYHNTGKVLEQNARGMHAGSEGSWVAVHKHIVFKRTGIWKFYDKKGKLIQTKIYK